MKRNTKNIICIIIIVLMCGVDFLTINYAQNNITSINNERPEQGNQVFNNMTPPDEESNDSNIQEKPNGDLNEENNKPNDIPEKPDSNSNNESNKPNDINFESNNMMSFNNQQFTQTEDNTSLKYIYYVIFGATSLVSSTIFIYLVMSRFNKKTFKQTFSNSDKIIINIFAVIILTTGLTYTYGIN